MAKFPGAHFNDLRRRELVRVLRLWPKQVRKLSPAGRAFLSAGYSEKRGHTVFSVCGPAAQNARFA
jgi:hypothetical protein